MQEICKDYTEFPSTFHLASPKASILQMYSAMIKAKTRDLENAIHHAHMEFEFQHFSHSRPFLCRRIQM